MSCRAVEVAALLPVLMSLSSIAQRAAALSLQTSLTDLSSFLKRAISTTWEWREAEWAQELEEETELKERGVWVEKPKPEEGTERVTRPAWPKEKWRVGLLDSL